jgi:hypothetical protein
MDPATPLRDAVLAGSFLGRDAAAVPLAALIAEADPAALLLGWFGEQRLAEIARDVAPAEALRGVLDRDIAA